MKWASKANAMFIMLSDDDVVLQYDVIRHSFGYKEMKNEHLEDHLYCGLLLNKGSRPLRTKPLKW